MTAPDPRRDDRLWGCLGGFLLVAGLFMIVVYQGVGGTMVEVEYQAIASAIAGGAILLLLGLRKSGWPVTRLGRLPLWVAVLVAAVASYLLFF